MKNWRGAGESGVRADRLHVRPWTDPRLLLGVLLVLGATALGARLVALNDNTTAYWSVVRDVRAGETLSSDQLVSSPVRLDGAAADRYLRVDENLPAAMADLQWDRDVSAGSLLDASALTRRDSQAVRQLPITVIEGASPDDLSRGDRVEVWVGPGTQDEAQSPSVRVLGPVRVLRSGADAEESLGGSLARTLLVEVPVAALTGKVVTTVASGRVTIVRVS
ncbi:MAG: hypothetical protein WBQ48_04875 [Aeromicrobium sp.]